jgi:hypothetical protein
MKYVTEWSSEIIIVNQFIIDFIGMDKRAYYLLSSRERESTRGYFSSSSSSNSSLLLLFLLVDVLYREII